MAKTLEQVREVSKFCASCPDASRVGRDSVDCCGALIAYANGKCHRNFWDNSAPVKFEPTIPPHLFGLCAERVDEEWPPEWQVKIRAAAIEKRGRRLIIPRELYDEALRHRKK